MEFTEFLNCLAHRSRSTVMVRLELTSDKRMSRRWLETRMAVREDAWGLILYLCAID
jgi:hypothetical protein